jgi:uncharacterized protein (DUF885 family)
MNDIYVEKCTRPKELEESTPVGSCDMQDLMTLVVSRLDTEIEKEKTQILSEIDVLEKRLVDETRAMHARFKEYFVKKVKDVTEDDLSWSRNFENSVLRRGVTEVIEAGYNPSIPNTYDVLITVRNIPDELVDLERQVRKTESELDAKRAEYQSYDTDVLAKEDIRMAVLMRRYLEPAPESRMGKVKAVIEKQREEEAKRAAEKEKLGNI